MQEESSIRQEQIRRATEEQIQAQRRKTEQEKAEIERETIRVRSLAEAEGRAHEAKLSEDVNRRMLVEKANAEREKWVSAINTTFEHIGGVFQISITFYICQSCLEFSIWSNLNAVIFSKCSLVLSAVFSAKHPFIQWIFSFLYSFQVVSRQY